jgi:hypothetical protein
VECFDVPGVAGAVEVKDRNVSLFTNNPIVIPAKARIHAILIKRRNFTTENTEFTEKARRRIFSP